MLHTFKHSRKGLSSTIVLLIALTAWCVELLFPNLPQIVSRSISGIELVSILVLFYLITTQQNGLLNELKQFLEKLSGTDLEESVGSGDSNKLLSPTSHPQLQQPLLRLQESMVNLVHGRHNAEHAKAGAEVRTRRATLERDTLREVLQTVADPIVAIDIYEDIVYANSAAEKLFGLAKQGESYGNYSQLLRSESLLTLVQETRKRFSHLSRNCMVVLTHEEQEHYYKATCRAITPPANSDKNALCSVVVILSDMESQRALQKRNAEFVSSVSHEMKTPLAGIRAYVELLADGDAEDETTRLEFLGVISSQAERLQRLVENLLNLARIEAGVVKVDKKPCSLNEILQEAYRVLAPTAELKNVKLSAELSPLYLGVFADHDTLLQAAINLGSNAIKYTPEGGKATLCTRADDHEVIFEVTDTGVGLSETDRLKVFEKFYRVAKDKNMAPGTGLGLPLVKHIVEDVHGGRVEVDSELGKGSTFRVILPTIDKGRAKHN